MGGGIGVDAAEFRAGKPGRFIGDDLGVRHLGDVAADRIKGQCRRVVILSRDLPVRHKAQFDQRLETVADTQDQAVSLSEQVTDRFLDDGISECCSEELGAAIRLITCGEAAGEHDDLRLLDRLRILIDALPDIER